MHMRVLKRTIASIALAAAPITGGVALAAPAGAQPVTQEGLVNVAVTDTTIQVPISVAANICDVNVAVLVQDLLDDSASCDADSTSEASVTPAGGDGPVNQSGLVNVAITDLTAQVPVSVAANVCDVNVGVLVGLLADDAAECDADGVSVATL
jgi:hypothetical protein